MAKNGKGPSARKPKNGADENESLLLRSAESLGRMIASLQRELDGASKRLAGAGGVRRQTPAKAAARKRTAAKATRPPKTASGRRTSASRAKRR